MEKAKICQSCGGPFGGEVKHGTNADGSINEDYCCYCFENGRFKDNNKTVEEMINYCVPLLISDNVFPNEAAARKVLQEQLPPLKRWKTA